MISLIIGVFTGLFIYGGLSSSPSNNPWLFSFAIILIFIISLYLLWKLYELYIKNKSTRLESKIKKEQLKEIKEKKDIQK